MIVIDIIETEMVCANDCPMWHVTHYDISKCTCYKKKVIRDIEKLKEKVDVYESVIDTADCMDTISDVLDRIEDAFDKPNYQK